MQQTILFAINKINLTIFIALALFACGGGGDNLPNSQNNLNTPNSSNPNIPNSSNNPNGLDTCQFDTCEFS